MDTFPSTSEITESTDELEFGAKMAESAAKHSFVPLGNRHSVEDDINSLFESIDIKISAKGHGLSRQSSKDSVSKKAMKRPIRVGSPQMSGIGISESGSLKQALRGLCISQASEMAAMKRISRPANSSGASEAGTIKRLYRTVVVEANGSGLPLIEGNGNLVEISLVPEKVGSSSSETAKVKIEELLPVDLPSSSHYNEKLPKVDEKGSESIKVCSRPPLPEGHKNCSHRASLPPNCNPVGMVNDRAGSTPYFMKPIFRNKGFMMKKAKRELAPVVSNELDASSSNSDPCDRTVDIGRKDSLKSCLASSSVNNSNECNSAVEDASSSKLGSSNSDNSTTSILTKVDERSRSREKSEFSQSSKSSIGDYSSSTGISEDSNLSGSSCCGSRPHMSMDLRWEAIHQAQRQYGRLGLKHFKLIKKLGCGDIGSVYLAELTGTNCLFALKVMDNEFLASRKKISRAETEREIMQMLDHPFLPTLYAHFVSHRFSCLVMEHCPGGDLHVLRQKQPGRIFSEQAARFYAAEILLALEYLHMLGVVYRDLKPENILVREDGHIMLSDFDLSLRCAVNPILVHSSSPVEQPARKMSSPCSEASCIDPFCMHPDWQVSCFTPRLLSVSAKSRKLKSDLAAQVSPLPQLVVEPTSARSNSFVGTHEYLAPEIIKGDGHGSAVDWWTFGIFLFELLYGRTPFKGSGNEETLSHVVSQSLKFPSSPLVSFHARDLIRGLLVKDPENRLGSAKGAAEIKQHSFFEGLNWALIRCTMPPEMPRFCDAGASALTTLCENKEDTKCKESKDLEDHIEFELF